MRKTKKVHPDLTHEMLLAKVSYDPATYGEFLPQ
jgi:hypothetical protein